MGIIGRVAIAALAVTAGLIGAARAEAPRVVASIAPLHSLVANVMAGVGEPQLLIRGFGSPHAYQLRPSEAADLAGADIVFWIGRDLETVLARPLEALGEQARTVALGEIDDVVRWPARAAGEWATSAGADHHADDHAGHAPTDPHIWLSPANASAMVLKIAETLAEVDATNAAVYHRNATETLRRIDALTQTSEQRLAPVRTVPFVVMHDAFQYLEKSYGLNAVGAISLSPDRPPSARRLSALRRTVKNLNAACAFSEPQMATALLDTVIEGTTIKRGQLDPLGAALPPGPDAYFAMMSANVDALVRCLTSAP